MASKEEQPFLHAAHRLDIIYMYTKYHQNISNCTSIIERTSFPTMNFIKDICGYFPASANGESCLGRVFRPLTDSDQHSFRYSYVISVFRHFLDKITN